MYIQDAFFSSSCHDSSPYASSRSARSRLQRGPCLNSKYNGTRESKRIPDMIVNDQPTPHVLIRGMIAVVAPAPNKQRKMLLDAVMDAERVGNKSTSNV